MPIEIKRADDFDKVKNESLREWLQELCDFIMEADYHDVEPEEVGWLMVMEPGDTFDDLKPDLVAELDICNYDCWEWVAFNEALGYWYAVMIIDDSFGMVYAFPSELIPDSLEKNLLDAADRLTRF